MPVRAMIEYDDEREQCLGVRVDLVVHVPIFFAVRHPVEPVAGDVETLALEQCVRLTEDVTVGWPV